MRKKSAETVPAPPFQAWIEERVAFHHRVIDKGRASDGVRQLCLEIGWDPDVGPRRLFRYRYGRSESTVGKCRAKGDKGMSVCRPMLEYPREVVEDALHHAGVALEDIYPRDQYPGLYPDIPLEDEAWCPSCREVCTPILGECPWCDTPVSDETLGLAA